MPSHGSVCDAATSCGRAPSSHRKNLPTLLRAFASVERLGRPRPRRSAPAGTRTSSPSSELFRDGVQARVKRLGWVPRDDLAALYAGAGVFCFPSLLEGFGFPVVEAMAHGTPVVTSRGTSTEELAEGGAGLLVDPTDVDDVASALSSVLENEALAGRLAPRRAGAGDALHVGDDGRSRLERLR